MAQLPTEPGQPVPVHNPQDEISCFDLNVPIQQACGLCLTTELMRRYDLNRPGTGHEGLGPMGELRSTARHALSDAVRTAAATMLTVAIIEE